jgi:hypothetical protein
MGEEAILLSFTADSYPRLASTLNPEVAKFSFVFEVGDKTHSSINNDI